MTSFQSGGRQAQRGRQRPRALVVSDDSQLVNLVERYFRARNTEVIAVQRLSQTRALAIEGLDLAVFDVTQDNDTAALARMVEALRVPTIALSSSASSEAAADLLRAGADSVITKPFTLDAFDAHLQALRRRLSGGTANSGPPRPYSYAGLMVDFLARSVTVNGRRVKLSAIQYRMLEFLCRHAGSVVSCRQLSDAVWGPGYDAAPALIRSHIRNLRKRLGDPASEPRFLRTERQMGYWVPRGQQEQG